MGGAQGNNNPAKGLEAAPEAAHEALSPTQEMATLAMEVLEGKSLHSPASKKIDSISLSEAVESQVENLKHLYLGAILLLTYLKHSGKLGTGSFSLSTFRNLSVPSSDLSPEQFSAFKKLREMATGKDSVVSSFWNSEIMSHLSDAVSTVSVATTAAVDVITGKEDRDVPDGERSMYDKTRDFANEHPVIAGTVALAGAMAVGYGLFKLCSAAKEKLGGKSSSPSSSAESTGESVWKWTKRLALMLGGTWIAGQILGLEEVQKWLKKKGLDVNANRFSKALVLFADFNVLEGIETLKRGVRDSEEERRHTDFSNEFGLNNSISVWVCADENCKDLLDMTDDSHTYSIAAPAALANIPFIGAIFTNEEQLEDERKLRKGLSGMRSQIEKIPGWGKMSIDEVLKQLAKSGAVAAPEGPRAQREMSDAERAVIAKQEEALVNQPSTQFDRLLASIDTNQSISREEKMELLAMIGGPESENSLLSDLHFMEDAIPGMWDTWKSKAFDVTAGAGSLYGEGQAGQAMIQAFGLDIEDREEMADLVKARKMLDESLGSEMERSELEMVRGLILEAEGFRDFVEGVGSGDKFDAGDLTKFRSYKKKFTGPDGIFKQVKLARQRASNTEFMDQRLEFGKWTVGDQGQAMLDLYMYSLFGYTLEAFVSAESTDADKGVGLALTVGTITGTSAALYAVRHPIVAAKSTVLPWRAAGWSKAKFHEAVLSSMASRLEAGAYTAKEAKDAIKFCEKIEDTYSLAKTGSYHMVSKESGKPVRQLATTLRERFDARIASGGNEFGRVAEADRLRRALRAGSAEHVDLVVRQISEYTGVSDDVIRRSVEIELQAGHIDDVVDAMMEARRASEAADQIDDISRAAAARQQLAAIGTYFTRNAAEGTEMLVRNRALVQLLAGNGVEVSSDVAMRLSRTSPSLLGAVDDPTLIAVEIEKLRSTMKVSDASEIASKANMAMKAERALLVLNVVVDIFTIGMSLYRIKDLEEMIANASNPAIRDIYANKLLREHANIALSGASLVVGVSAIALQSSAVVGALGSVIGSAAAASAASASTGVGLVLIPVIIVAGGVMHVQDVMDEGRIEIAREKEDWKQLSPADLYRQWVTMVGTNDSEELIAFFNWKNVCAGFTGISYMVGGYDERDKRMEAFRQEKVVTRREIVEALTEKQLKLFGGAGDLLLSSYAMQYMEATLGQDFDAGTIEMARESVQNAASYARMMAAREHAAVRREFFAGDTSEYLGSDYAVSSHQTRLTALQVSILPPAARRDYEMLLAMTPYADMVPDATVFDSNAAVLPADYDAEIDTATGLDSVLGDFGVRVKTHAEARLRSAEHKPVFERLLRVSDYVVLQKMNAIQTVYSTTGSYPPNAVILLPTLELYAQYKGLSSGFDVSYPSSVEALDKWCFDLLVDHAVPAGDLTARKAMMIRTDEEVMAENGVFDDKFLYVLHRIAVEVFGYSGSADEESIKRLYSSANANVFGIYWDGAQWVVQEGGMESDNELPRDTNPDQLISQLLIELENHGDDLFEETGDSMWVSSRSEEDREFFRRSEAIAAKYREVIMAASERYATESIAALSGFDAEATAYIQEHATCDAYVVLPGYLIAKGIQAGKQDLGLFSYRYENGAVVCYQMYEGSELTAPIGNKVSRLESFEVADATKQYTDAMYADLAQVRETVRISDDEFDIPASVDLLIDSKRLEVDTFVAGLASFPEAQQETMAISKASEIDEFRRVVELSVLTEAASGSFWAFRWSDDVDSETVDESIQGNLAMHQTFNYHPVLREQWESLRDVSASISNNVAGEKHSAEYMLYFDQAMSLALVKSIALNRNVDTGKMEVQSWKGLDMEQFDRNIAEVLLYDEWMKEYKGEDSGSTSADFRFEFKESCMEALAG
ncbi:hypothetical protein COW94_03285 [Candidatus Peregrinibacteria bacterium CG22_combo_CG10-13_8_21_14_all_44_10]|nr:MAG: hypothetical protein AUK45_03840 [Candidatus Peregrinibacteria bacterium CG2_30_44_17]PIP66138.1 MAG: hypothetical protein COW94_03285 [Candidatus Peregrinibacteria bacterium CG22_combo_CG10-13_8_21_14_all_44_10]PIS04204.1 MAG: hypothetical protein COT83_01825 [Candidatus Peregrinibacteria bacterium CG10_big_fil_rev_8_21_14_0_10_44_7]PIX79783.1 MAG: hypothetical protein COZ35_02860 [Candidatus Peregrinibacteria bacterium CG_4_10_14_3_um_filter_44_21]PJB88341.1 MAG: hypothetical protein 